jgi:hypothetical protein
MNGEWIWILLALFGIFRLLMLAGKKKEGQTPPAAPESGRTPPAAPREEVDELKRFIDSLAGRVGAEPRGQPPAPPRGWSTVSPPPQRPRPAVRPSPPAPPRPPAPRPEPVQPLPVRLPSLVAPESPVRPVPGFFSSSLHPVVRGIIFSEILGPPRGLGGGARLPSDIDNF